VNIYPNPAKDVLNIEFVEGFFDGDVRVGLFSILGSKVKENAYVAGEGRIQVDVGDVGKGIYLLRFFSDGRMVTRKVFVE